MFAHGWGCSSRGVGTVGAGRRLLAGGTAIPNPSGPGLWALLTWEVVTTRFWSGLLEPPARDGGGGSADLIPDICSLPPCSRLSVVFSGGLQKHFRELNKCVSGKCNGFGAPNSLKCFCKSHHKRTHNIQLFSINRQTWKGVLLVLVCSSK